MNSASAPADSPAADETATTETATTHTATTESSPADAVPADDVPAETAPVDAIDLDAIHRDLDGVEAALTRLDDGTYWSDELTGAPLTDELLADDPTARRADD